MVPDPGQQKNSTVFWPDKIRLLAPRPRLPFIKSAGRDNAAPVLERTAKGQLFLNTICPGIIMGNFVLLVFD